MLGSGSPADGPQFRDQTISWVVAEAPRSHPSWVARIIGKYFAQLGDCSPFVFRHAVNLARHASVHLGAT